MQAFRCILRVRTFNIGKCVRNSVYLSYKNAPKLFKRSFNKNTNQLYRLCSVSAPPESLVDALTFEKVCDDTLESLSEYFEQIIEEADNLKSADVSYSSGVLTVNLGPEHGTYVINRQTPNKQIWLSSPTSGPKRYDFIVKDNSWVYKHDGQSLHELLQKEISKIVSLKVDFAKCSYARIKG